MRTQLYRSLLLFLFSSLFTLQLSQATLHDSTTIPNFASIAYSTPPTTGIFFEYGGEGGDVGETITGFEYNTALWYAPYVETTYVSSPVRTGTRAVKMWTMGDTSETKARRNHLRKGNVPQFEGWDRENLYFSGWVYIPDDNNIHDEDVGWVDLFGFQAFWRGDNNPSGGDYRADRTNWRFKLDTKNNKHYFAVSYLMEWFNPDYYDTKKFWADGNGGRPEYYVSTSNTTLCNQWIHLQVFMHWSNSTDGYYTAWINDDLLANYTTPVANDPRGWSRWSDENCEWKYPSSGQPAPLIELYHATNEPEMWYYWDDAVASTTYVPSSHRVIDKP